MGQRSAWATAVLIFLQFGCMGTRVAETEHGPIAKTRSGVIEGMHFGSKPNDAAFLGVPYAAPPTGELRWKPPQPAARWSAIRKADRFGSPCPQLPARWFHYIDGNEDCLYLNIWTSDPRPGANRPVLVYFHGGSNTQGYGQMTPIGPPLSQMGLVVVRRITDSALSDSLLIRHSQQNQNITRQETTAFLISWKFWSG